MMVSSPASTASMTTDMRTGGSSISVVKSQVGLPSINLGLGSVVNWGMHENYFHFQLVVRLLVHLLPLF